MNRQIRNIIISLCVVAVLVVVLILIKVMPGGKTTKASSSKASTGITLIKADTSKVATVHISNQSGAFTIRKGASTTTSSGSTITWNVDELANYPINQSSVSNIVEEATALSASSSLGQVTSGIDQYGLAAPKATMELKTTDNKDYTLYVGNATPTKNGYYAMLKGSSEIYIIGETSGDDFSAASKSLIDMSIVSLDSTKYATLTDITYGGTSRSTPLKLAIDETSASAYSATTDSNGSVLAPSYRITSPGNYTANTSGMNTIFTDLSSLQASDIVSLDTTDKSLSQYGLKNAANTFTFTYNKKSYTISFGNTFSKDSTDYIYIMMSGKNLIYSVTLSSVSFYKFQLVDLMPSLIYTAPNIDTIKEITATFGVKSWKYSLTGTGDALKIASDGKTLSTENFRKLYEQYISLSPQGIASDSANNTELGRITITYRTGNKVDTIIFKTLPDTNDPSKADGYKALCVVNGSGNFYIKKSFIDSLAQYSQDIVNGKTVPAP
jgi:hypothetical protein